MSICAGVGPVAAIFVGRPAASLRSTALMTGLIGARSGRIAVHRSPPGPSLRPTSLVASPSKKPRMPALGSLGEE